MPGDPSSNQSETETNQPRRRRLRRLIRFLIAGVMIYFLLDWLSPDVPPPRSGLRKGVLPHLHTIGLAQKNYASQAEGRFAPPTVVNSRGAPVFGWYVRLLPLLDDADRYDQIDFELPYNHPNNAKLFQSSTTYAYELVPEIKRTTNADGYGLIHFTLNERIFPDNQSLTEDFLANADGFSSTILLGEIETELPAWGAPGNARDPARGLKSGPNMFGVSVHDGKTAIGFADGSARMLNNNIDPAVLKALSTPDGGEVLPEDW